ncbi:proline rich transmembrane protein 1B [Cyrtonyx montezumae]|uniref:proline rich transmembrane protein 1B n=1 Tax=Cyrtonyx montezumae TaxID=9017 RepID=UPI0032DA5E83
MINAGSGPPGGTEAVGMEAGAGAGPRVVAAAVSNAAFEGDPPPYSPPDPKSAQLLFPVAFPHRPHPHPPPFVPQPLPYAAVRSRARSPRPPGAPAAADPPSLCLQCVGPPGTGPPTAAQRPPKDYLVESVLVTVFCCLFTGLAALLYSHETRTALGRGDVAQAQAASKKTQSLVLLSLLLGLFASFTWVVYVLVALYR